VLLRMIDCDLSDCTVQGAQSFMISSRSSVRDDISTGIAA
jgi:hypothetical protein